MLISSGCKGDKTISCDGAFTIGIQIMQNTHGMNYKNLKFQRKSRILPLKAATAIKLKNDEIIIDPTLLFQRIAVAMEGGGDLNDTYRMNLYLTLCLYSTTQSCAKHRNQSFMTFFNRTLKK